MKCLKLAVSLSIVNVLLSGTVYEFHDYSEYAYRCITSGTWYYIPSNARIDIAVLVSTIKEIVLAHKLSQVGTWIEQSDYSWHEYGLIALDFSSIHTTDSYLLPSIIYQMLQRVAQEYYLGDLQAGGHCDVALRKLLKMLRAKYGKVAVILESCDSPLKDFVHDKEHCRECSRILFHFFTLIKSQGHLIDCLLATGKSSYCELCGYAWIDEFCCIDGTYLVQDIEEAIPFGIQ